MFGDDADDDDEDFFGTGGSSPAPWASSGGSGPFGGGGFGSGLESNTGLGGGLGNMLAADADSKRGNHMSLGYQPMTKQGLDRQIEEKRKEEEAAKERAATSAIFACRTTLMQYDAQNQAHVVPGDCVAAILHNSLRQVYTLVVYREANGQQQILCSLPAPFDIIVQAGLYVQFYDANRKFWCLQLDSQENVDELAQHVAGVAHTLLLGLGTFTSTVIQELNPPPDPNVPAAGIGDKAKVKYEMCLLADTHPKGRGTVVGRVGYSKADLVKLGEHKTLKGIEEALVGMRKGQRRCLIIPAHLAYGPTASGNIPGDSTLLVTLECCGVRPKGSGKSKRSASTSVASPAPVAEDTSAAAAASPSTNQPTTRQTRTASVAERMARMGVNMMMGASPAKPAAGAAPTSAASPSSAEANALVRVPDPEPPVVTGPAVTPQPQQVQQVSSPTPQPALNQSNNSQHNVYQQQQQQQQQGQVGGVPGGYTGPFGAPVQQGQGFPGTHPGNPGIHPGNPPQANMYGNAAAPGMMNQFGAMNPSVGFGMGGNPMGGFSPNIQQLAGMLDHVHKQVNKLVALHSGNLQDSSFEQPMTPIQVLNSFQRLLKERDAAVAEAKEKSDKAATLSGKVEQLLEKNEQYMRENANLTQQRYSSMQTASSEHNQAYNTLLQEKREVEFQLAQKAMDLERAKFDSERAVQQQTLALQTELHQVRSTVESARAEAIATHVAQAKQESAAALAAAKQEAETQLTQLREEMAAKEEAASKVAVESRSQLASLQEQAGQHEQTAQQLLEDKTVLEEQLSSLQAQMATTREQLQSTQSELKQQGADSEETSGTIDALKSQIASLEAEKAQLSEETCRLNEQAATARNSAEKEAETLRGQVTELQEHVKQLEADHEEMIVGINKLKASKANMKEQAQARVAQVQKEAEEQEAAVMEQCTARINKLRAALKEAREVAAKAASQAESGNAEEAVKGVMKQVYVSLREAFTEEESYDREDIHEAIRDVIREVTLAQMNQGEEEEEAEEEPEEEPEEVEAEDE